MFFLNWPRAYGLPHCKAIFKKSPEDFQVKELFSSPFSGEGEHLLLKIEKKGINTQDVIKSLAKKLAISEKIISYAGLKDRQAVSSQWFSVHLPGKEVVDIAGLNDPHWRVVDNTRHRKKLKPGFLTANHFLIRLYELSDPYDLERRLEIANRCGVPNYFGEQRFGLGAVNLIHAEQWFKNTRFVNNRFLRGMYLSATRAWLFNQILGQRVLNNTWNQVLAGDVIQLNGSNSIFQSNPDLDLLKRIENKDLAPASPLCGRSKNLVQDDALQIIDAIYAQWPHLVTGLLARGLEESWRSNMVWFDKMEYKISKETAELSFNLPVGTYATSLLRELIQY